MSDRAQRINWLLLDKGIEVRRIKVTSSFKPEDNEMVCIRCGNRAFSYGTGNYKTLYVHGYDLVKDEKRIDVIHRGCVPVR